MWSLLHNENQKSVELEQDHLLRVTFYHLRCIVVPFADYLLQDGILKITFSKIMFSGLYFKVGLVKGKCYPMSYNHEGCPIMMILE